SARLIPPDLITAPPKYPRSRKAIGRHGFELSGENSGAGLRTMKISHKPLLALAAVAAAASFLSARADVLNVYSHRHYAGDQEINRLFTEKTGIEVKVVNADADQLIERLKTEGENSPADLLLTVDAGRLQRAK